MTQATRIETAAPADDSKTRLRLWLRILSVSRLIEAELRERLRSEFDTTLPRFDVLAALQRARKGLKMSELSSVLRVSNGNVTGIVDRLVADGLVVRVPVAGDRRAMTVRSRPRAKASSRGSPPRTKVGWTISSISVSAAEANRLIARLQAVRDRIEARRA